jgi:hypothetical protein
MNAKLTLVEVNAMITDPVVKLPDGSEVEFDVYAGADLSNAGDMLCVSSSNSLAHSAKQKEKNLTRSKNQRPGPHDERSSELVCPVTPVLMCQWYM